MADTAVIPGDPFAFQFAQHSLLVRAAFGAARPLLSTLLHLPGCGELYRQAQALSAAGFEANVLRALDVRIGVQTVDGAAIPSHGALIVAANHPTGALDGLVVGEAIRQVRADVRVLANHLLSVIPELRESCFFVDPFGGPFSAARSLEGLRAAHMWLRRGGALVVFPAGEVAWQLRTERGYVDSPWLPTVGRLAKATRAQVLPVFLANRSSRLFHAAGRLHPGLRTAMLPRELLRQRGTVARVVVGPAIAPEVIAGYANPELATSGIRRAVDDLVSAPQVRAAPLAAPIDPAELERDVDALPCDARLLSSGVYDVFCAGAAALPRLLPEIGRLREATFRAVGEGTGQPLDLDRFDEHYQHLFVWNRKRRQVVGAYRVGATDRILDALGVAGLYTSTLFKYDERLLRRLSPALELGRAFVRAEYQRSHNSLFLLWRGIGRLVSRAPEYRYLFGPVSISSRYQDTTQQMLRAYLAQHHGDDELATLVEAVNPPRPVVAPVRGSAAINDLSGLDQQIARLEPDGIPVLLRQYLRLNATLLGFNVDPAFGDALDALMMVDLTALPARTLQRYLGRDEARAFLDLHRSRAGGAAAA